MIDANPIPGVRTDADVVIVGAGFAGLEAARTLGRSGVRTLVIDQHNYHLFQPLLYQVATAALSPANIAQPIRAILRRYPSVETRLARVIGIDRVAKHVVLESGEQASYRHLVVATGATHAYFGHDEWSAVAPGLKTIADARAIRAHLLRNFELAEQSADPVEQRQLLTFAVVGGGPTGVELAGSIAELARYTLARDFRRIHPGSAIILLFEAGDRILTAFPESLSRYTRKRLERMGVQVRLRSPITHISATSVEIENETIPAGLVVWAAGVAASPVGRLLDVPLDRAGRVQVNPDLSLTGADDIYVLGDLAIVQGKDGRPLPGLAQVAKQQGAYIGRALFQRLRSGTRSKPFVFRNRGNVAIIGRHAAVFDLGWAQFTGFIAWVLWAIIHVYLLVGFEHRILVTVQWIWRYLTYESGSRLIMDDDAANS